MTPIEPHLSWLQMYRQAQLTFYGAAAGESPAGLLAAPGVFFRILCALTAVNGSAQSTRATYTPTTPAYNDHTRLMYAAVIPLIVKTFSEEGLQGKPFPCRSLKLIQVLIILYDWMPLYPTIIISMIANKSNDCVGWPRGFVDRTTGSIIRKANYKRW